MQTMISEQYEVVKVEKLADINSKGYLLKHKKSGARIQIISNDDENKTFYICFRTPPENSCGTTHIIEHSVLCGSEKFPAKDPFVELVKGSLNTFLNAMTYSDKTVYPVASCNDKDFQNLCDVYLDAVLNPNISKRPEIFKQEGWHYELNSKDEPLAVTGVVYNEMKGAFSSPEGVLDREILNSLFPDTAYCYESGGNPEEIPNLTYEMFLDYYKKYYHPSNSYIYLYGDMDINEKLEWLDKEYLSKYDMTEIDSEVKIQKAFSQTREVVKEYSISQDENENDNTFLSYNKVIDYNSDRELELAFSILEYALVSSPGAVIKKALLDAKIGKDIIGSFENGIIQPYFSIVAKNSEESKKEEFIRIIEDVLKDQIKNGINKKALLAGINITEFSYREGDFGNFPKGLIYGLNNLETWLYDDNQAFERVCEGKLFDSLRQKIDSGYFEKIVEKYILNNNHSSIVIVKPVKGLTAKNDALFSEKLATYKATLSDEELERLVEDTKALKKYQEEPSTKEELESIPMLSIDDIKKEINPLNNVELNIENTKVLWHDMFSNKINYIKFLFNAGNIKTQHIPYLSILKNILCSVDTKNHDYSQLSNDIHINTGGIGCAINIFSDVKQKDDFSVYFDFKTKVLYEKTDFAIKTIAEIISGSKFDNKKRIYEIIAEIKSHLQTSLLASGHIYAIERASSYYSKTMKFHELISGIEYYRLIDDLEKNFDDRYDELVSILNELIVTIFRKENLMVSITCDEEGLNIFKENYNELLSSLFTENVENQGFELDCQKKNEGFKSSSKVSYVVRCGNFRNSGFDYTGSLRVLKVILSYDYLWLNIRVKGGAYGCMSGFSRTGDIYFATYRDPNIKESNEIFDKMPEYLEKFDVDERDMTKYIIGAISSLDTPLNPCAKGERSFGSYMMNISEEDLQAERNQVLNTKKEDIRNLKEMIEKALLENYLCVVGNEEKIEKEKDLFDNVLNLM
ncbi:hypothetical protein SAMN05216249_101118 [Acetitomaculum ruminis DSM 5522]|uniref:Peptidase M16C associated domain-containing protein n=1 Tax=Acetitomaculum ruminis DSM 5522 TaxID=1120918 RepID=A0A1I0V259_9FIRM|nr:insulinase family protein [Acetitomaculum ruminis]SFA70414.1 hypothetical protein SAMN05216249_101118 [Acetitomaculum ruminis DSM 5522]